MCSGEAFFQRAKSAGLRFSCCPSSLAGVGEEFLHAPPGEFAVVVFAVVGFDVEIDAAFAFIGESVFKDSFHELHLLDDVPGRMRFDAWGEGVQLLHVLVVAVGVILHDLHRFQALQFGFLGNFILAVIAVVGEVPHVGDVADVAHLIAEVLQVAEDEVEGDGGTGVPQMGVAVNRGTADIQPYERGIERFERFFPAGEGVVDVQLISMFFLLLFEWLSK